MNVILRDHPFWQFSASLNSFGSLAFGMGMGTICSCIKLTPFEWEKLLSRTLQQQISFENSSQLKAMSYANTSSESEVERVSEWVCADFLVDWMPKVGGFWFNCFLWYLFGFIKWLTDRVLNPISSMHAIILLLQSVNSHTLSTNAGCVSCLDKAFWFCFSCSFINFSSAYK